MDIVTARQLRIRDSISGRVLLDDINFSVGRGETVAILGESGAGKTLLGRCLAGSLPKNLDVLNSSENGGPAVIKARDARVTLVPQAPILPPLLSVERLIRSVLNWSSPPAASNATTARVEELLDWVSFPSDRVSLGKRPFQLSGGQIQRVALAAALATSPSLLILDEPTVGLDPLLRQDLCKILLELNREHGVAILLTTHDIPAAAEVARHTLILRAGRGVATGEWERLLADPDPYVRRLLSPLAIHRERRPRQSPTSIGLAQPRASD